MMDMKILVTGSSGMLGSAFMAQNYLCKLISCPSSAVDITDFAGIKNFIGKEAPDVIIHCAAFTDVEKCEVERDLAYGINTIGTMNLVNAVIELSKPPIFCYISSAGVYGAHKNEPYCEFDDVAPTTIHHDSKLQAEKIVATHLTKHLILRVGWLYGGSVKQPKNFVYKRYLEAKSNSTIYSNISQVGNPTFVDDVVRQCLKLIQERCYGVYNCANSGSVSRYGYVQAIVKLFGLDCGVEIADKANFKRIANVSDNEALVNYKLNLQGLNIMPNWEESLKYYIEGIKNGLY